VSTSATGPVRIVGIDPGSRVTGYGVIESSAGRQRVVAFGRICTDDGPLPSRLLQIQNELAAILREHRPTEAAVEQVFVKSNATTAVVLGQARGVALCTAAAAGLAVSEYAATQIKLAVTGSGRAEKPQVAQMVKLLLKLSEAPPSDAADALAVALCHAQVRSTLSSIARAMAR
jgi:crossover junction endodeoxyribonuclease RuvC